MDDQITQLLTDIRDELRIIRTHLEPPPTTIISGRFFAAAAELTKLRRIESRDITRWAAAAQTPSDSAAPVADPPAH